MWVRFGLVDVWGFHWKNWQQVLPSTTSGCFSDDNRYAFCHLVSIIYTSLQTNAPNRGLYWKRYTRWHGEAHNVACGVSFTMDSLIERPREKQPEKDAEWIFSTHAFDCFCLYSQSIVWHKPASQPASVLSGVKNGTPLPPFLVIKVEHLIPTNLSGIQSVCAGSWRWLRWECRMKRHTLMVLLLVANLSAAIDGTGSSRFTI